MISKETVVDKNSNMVSGNFNSIYDSNYLELIQKLRRWKCLELTLQKKKNRRIFSAVLTETELTANFNFRAFSCGCIQLTTDHPIFIKNVKE